MLLATTREACQNINKDFETLLDKWLFSNLNYIFECFLIPFAKKHSNFDRDTIAKSE